MGIAVQTPRTLKKVILDFFMPGRRLTPEEQRARRYSTAVLEQVIFKKIALRNHELTLAAGQIMYGETVSRMAQESSEKLRKEIDVLKAELERRGR